MSVQAKTKPVVLVAEDDEDILALVVFDLEDEGYEVLTARNGKEAISLAFDRLPDLILLDVAMPGLDGYEVTRRLRAEESTRGTPVVLLTARAQVRDVILGFEAGANDYVTKPFRPDELPHPPARRPRAPLAIENRPGHPGRGSAERAPPKGDFSGGSYRFHTAFAPLLSTPVADDVIDLAHRREKERKWRAFTECGKRETARRWPGG